MRRFLITGGAGFIGSNFIRRLLTSDPTATVVNLDLLTYAGVEMTVRELDRLARHEFVHGDIRDPSLVDSLMANVDVVVNFAAESHVDRSIAAPDVFLSTNVVGAGVLLESAMRHDVPRFIHVSTDEVYGPIDGEAVAEDAALNPSSPYAASKAAADLLVGAYGRTHGYRAIITRCTNNYGPYQHPEKLIPLAITRLFEDGEVPLYGDGTHERDWIWVEDHCDAVRLLVESGVPGEVYNVGSGVRSSNLSTVETLRRLVGAGSIAHVADRPGHDRRYAVDSSKLEALGWAPTVTLEEGLAGTVDWYRRRRDWWEPLVGPP